MVHYLYTRGIKIPQFQGEGAPLAEIMEEYERLLPFLYPNPESTCPKEKLHYYRLQQEGCAVFRLTVEGYFWGPRNILGIDSHL